MRVIVEAVSGPSGTRRFVLGSGQSFQIGRTEWADAAFPRDGHMSGVHFRLETDQRACYVQDAGSANGTLLNGQPATGRVAVRDGDEIVAGQTHFVVHMEEDVHEQVAIPAAEFPPAGHGAAASGAPAAPAAWTPRTPPMLSVIPGLVSPAEYGAAAVRGPSPGREASADRDPPPAFGGPSGIPMPPKVPFTAETCESKITLCRGNLTDIAPADLAVRLSRLFPVHLIVDFNHLGSPPPPELANPQYVFDWLGPVTAPLVSPVFLSQTDMFTWPELVAQGWGNDAVICLFSREEGSAVLEHLRRSCKAHSGQNDAVLGCCWPSVLTPLLSSSQPDFVGRLLHGIDGVLAELPDLPETWQIYGSRQIVDDLQRIGLFQQPAAKIGP